MRGVRGPGGGYRLGRDSDSISIADIITAVNEDLDATAVAGETVRTVPEREEIEAGYGSEFPYRITTKV